MKHCNQCGGLIDDNAIICIHCGTNANGSSFNGRANNNPYGAYGNPYGNPYGSSPFEAQPIIDEKESFGLSVLSFFFWYVGIILWLTMRRTRPGKARSALKGTLCTTSMSMPIFGLVGWLLWRRDPGSRGYAKACGIGAIIGAGFYITIFAVAMILQAFGVSYEAFFSSIPSTEDILGGMTMYIGTFFGRV